MVVAHNRLYESDSRTGLQSGQAPHGGSHSWSRPWKGRGQGASQGERDYEGTFACLDESLDQRIQRAAVALGPFAALGFVLPMNGRCWVQFYRVRQSGRC